MKRIGIIVSLAVIASIHVLYGQSTIVKREGQVIVLQEGRSTDRAIDGRYIYRNDVDTAYALVVGHFYTTKEVEKAFGKAQNINDGIGYYNGIPTGGSISYIYDSLFLSLDYDFGLCEFNIDRKNITFSDLGKNIKLGDNFSVLTDDPDFQPLVTRQSKVYRDEKTGRFG